jgi:integrase
MRHDVSQGFLQKVGRNYFMWLSVDGQKRRRRTGTDDIERATEMLAEWRAQEKIGAAEADSKLRYEAMRDTYVAGGNQVPRDLDIFFKSMRIVAIDVKKLDKYRVWRENSNEVLKAKTETLRKEIALRMMQASRGRALTQKELDRIEAEATTWVENGVKATTNKRLGILRAMFYNLAKRGDISKNAIPFFPMAAGVDNVRTNKFSADDFEGILRELPARLHAYVKFLYVTGMRSGQAANLTWEMIDENNNLVVPGIETKNGEAYSIALVDEDGKAYDFTAFVNQRSHGPIFDTTDFRNQWRKACDKLGLGIFDQKTRSYRGAHPHDFRRTAITNMNAAGIDRGDAMSISGHKTESMYSRYGIQDFRTSRRVFSKLA